MSEAGTVYLVGAGPGDADLITVRGRSLIEECDVLVMDQLVSPVFTTWTKSDCEVLLMGKGKSATHSHRQADIEKTLVDRARSGCRVVRLKGGDPFIFGRGGEEVEALSRAGIAFEIIPGVTAALAAAAACGIPLTHRNSSSSLVFLTGHEDPTKEEPRNRLREFARCGGTLCIYMGMARLAEIVAELQEGGLDPETPAAIIQWAFTPQQRTVEAPLEEMVETVRKLGMDAPSVIFIGEVVGRNPDWSWYARRSLHGKHILVTRSRNQSGRLRGLLEAKGARVAEIPMIETRLAVEPEVLGEVLAGIAAYEWIVFTSPNGARYFFELFFKAFSDIRSIGGARFAAIGKSTAKEIERWKLQVDLLPQQAVAESLADALVETQSLPHGMVLVVTGNLNREILVRKLEEEGEAIVDTLQVYETYHPQVEESPDLDWVAREGIDYVVFTSSSTVEHYTRNRIRIEKDGSRSSPRYVSMGPITSSALLQEGIADFIEAEESSLEAVVDAIEKDAIDTSGAD